MFKNNNMQQEAFCEEGKNVVLTKQGQFCPLDDLFSAFKLKGFKNVQFHTKTRFISVQQRRKNG